MLLKTLVVMVQGTLKCNLFFIVLINLKVAPRIRLPSKDCAIKEDKPTNFH